MRSEAALFREAVKAPIRSDLLNNEPFSLAKCPSPQAQHWYALHTRSRYEKVVDRLLNEKGYETFLPLIVKRSPVTYRRWREAQIPLFAGYIFVRFSAHPENFHRVRTVNGVAGIVGGGSGPVSIPDAEIESVQAVIAQKVNCSVSAFAKGQPVMITGGPLKGIRGEMVRRKNCQAFVVKVQLIRRLLEVELSNADLEAVAPLSAGSGNLPKIN